MPFCAVGSVEKLMTRSANKSDVRGIPSQPPDAAREVWGALVPHVVHPAKVATIEAMLWLKQPLSSNQLDQQSVTLDQWSGPEPLAFTAERWCNA